MKIGIIARTWFTSTKGGSERYIGKLLDELRGRHEVKVLTLDRCEDKDVIQIKLPKITLVTQFLFSFMASRRMNNIKPDVCLVNQYWGEFSPLLLKAPWIPIIHDIGLFSLEALKHPLKHFLRKKVLEQVTKKARLIIVPSKLTTTDLQTYLNVPLEKIWMIPEGVDLNAFRPNSVKHHGVNIVCVGRIAPNKGQDILLKAFDLIKKNHPESKLYIVGGVSKFQKGYYKKLLNLIKTLNVRDIIFTGNISDDELVKYYNLADIYVQPSIGEEGWGMTIVEAFASKKPVICTDIFYRTGVADKDRAKIVKGGDPMELAKTIEMLIKNDELCKKLVEEGYKFAQKLSWKRMTEGILGAVNHL